MAIPIAARIESWQIVDLHCPPVDDPQLCLEVAHRSAAPEVPLTGEELGGIEATRP